LDVEVLTKLLNEKKEMESLFSGLLMNEKSTKRKLQQEVQGLKENVQGLETEIQKSREEVQKLKKTLESTEAERAQFLKEKEMAERKMLSLSGNVHGKLTEIEKIRDQLSSVINEAQKMIAKELDRIELAPISVTTKPQGSVSSVVVSGAVSDSGVQKESVETGTSGRLSGQVLVVNTDLNFIVVNLGAERGSYSGLRFEVMSKSDGKLMGIAKVIEVRRNISAADLQEKQGAVEVGDEVFELLE
jgi:predicted RNase H-like nuclease (RuvC/YqgF family)